MRTTFPPGNKQDLTALESTYGPGCVEEFVLAPNKDLAVSPLKLPLGLILNKSRMHQPFWASASLLAPLLIRDFLPSERRLLAAIFLPSNNRNIVEWGVRTFLLLKKNQEGNHPVY